MISNKEKKRITEEVAKMLLKSFLLGICVGTVCTMIITFLVMVVL